MNYVIYNILGVMYICLVMRSGQVCVHCSVVEHLSKYAHYLLQALYFGVKSRIVLF